MSVPKTSNPASRRGFLAGLGAISAAGGAGVALPVLAASAAATTGPHPDQGLLDAEAACVRATAAADAAKKASSAAWLVFHDAVGTGPEELILQTWEERAFVTRTSGRFVGGVKTHLIPSTDTSGAWIAPTFAWSAEGLTRAIALAPGAFGRAGHTPHMIRHWRSLMPLAAQFDAMSRRWSDAAATRNCRPRAGRRTRHADGQRRACIGSRPRPSKDWPSTRACSRPRTGTAPTRPGRSCCRVRRPSRAWC